MRLLAIDSATEACSVALFDDGALIAGDYRLLGRGHAEQLVPMIAALPGQGRADRIAVSLGPGSFTGVRVGLAAARALSFAWGAELVGYPTLALVGAMARDQHGATPVCVAMTGGHGEWFCEAQDEKGQTIRPLASLRPDEACAAPEHLVAGSQAEALVTRRNSGVATALLPDARCVHLLPADIFSCDVHPLYGRAPDAKLPGGKSPEQHA